MTHVAEASPASVHVTGERWRMAVRGLGQLLITLGLVILLFVVYELYGTGLYTKAQQDKLEKQLAQDWLTTPHGSVPTDISKTAPKDVPIGSGIAVLRIPRFGDNWHIVVVEGTGYEDLKKGPGHYPGTALPGQVGNFAVAGHRTTYEHPFNAIDTIRSGDAIVLETRTMWFTYRVHDIAAGKGYPEVPYQEIVDPSDVAVSYPVPDQPDPGKKPSLKLLTFTSCNPKYSAAQRIVVHAQLAQKLHKGPGVVPPALES
jgi:sortase A